MRKVKLAEITTLLSGCPFDASLFNDERIGLPLIRVRDVNSGFAGFYYSGEYDKQYLIKEGDILISLDGDFKAIEWRNGEALLNQRVCKIIPQTESLNKKFLLHFLPDVLNEIHRKTRFTTVKHLSTKTINNIELVLPKLPDQLHIANILSKAENLIAQRKESIRLLDEFLKSTFLQMFGNPVRNEKGWKVYPFSELVADDCPLTYGIVQPGNEFPNGVPVVRPVDLTHTNITRQGLKLIDPKISEQFKRTILKGGELLMCVRGSTGVVSIASSELAGCNVTRGITPIWFSNNYNSLFAYGLFQTNAVKNCIQELTYGATLKQINLGDLRKIKLITPPIELQTQFAQIVEKTEALKSQYQQSLQELQNLYGSLSQRAFRGEIINKSLKV